MKLFFLTPSHRALCVMSHDITYASYTVACRNKKMFVLLIDFVEYQEGLRVFS